MTDPKITADAYDALREALQGVVNTRVRGSVMVTSFVATVNISDGVGNSIVIIAPPTQPMAMDSGLHQAGAQLMDIEMTKYLNPED